MKKIIALSLLSIFAFTSCATDSSGKNNNDTPTPSTNDVRIYLELGQGGLYNGNAGYAVASKSLVNAVSVNFKVGDNLPTSASVTYSDSSKTFVGWDFYANGEEIPTIVTTATAAMNDQVLYAKWNDGSGGGTQDSSGSSKPVDINDKEDSGTVDYGDINEKETMPSDYETEEIDEQTLAQYEKDLYIGYGYDITCQSPIYDKENSVPRMHPILDYSNTKFRNSIRTDSVNSLVAYNKKTASQKAMLEEYGNSVSGGINATVSMVNTSIDTIFDTSHSTKAIKKESYEIYSMVLKKNRFLSQLSINDLKTCLDTTFQNALYAVKNEADALKLFNDYGTHLIRGYTLGGVLNVTNYFGSYSSSYSQRNTLSIKQQLSAAIGIVNAGESFSFENTYASEEQLDQCVSNYAVTAYGGDGASLLTIDNLFTYNQEIGQGSSGYEYGRWVNSINEGKGLTIVSIPKQTAMLPLWNLLPSTAEYSTIKETLINAYVKNCKTVYDAYIAEHPDCAVNEVDEEKKNFDLDCKLNGVLETKASGYSNYVETPDSFETENITIQKGSDVSLDIETNYDTEEVEWYVDDLYKDDITFTSTRKGLFKVNENAKNSTLILKLKVNDVYCVSVTFNIKNINPSFPGGGTGTENDPYLIADKDNLKNYLENGNYFDSYIKLVRNIDFNKDTLNPIDVDFTGHFDGNYCKLSNFVIVNGENSIKENYGLFPKNNGTVKNLFIENSMVCVGSASKFEASNISPNEYIAEYRKQQSKAKYIGVLTGENKSNGVIENCSVSGSKIVFSQSYNSNQNLIFYTGIISASNQGTIKRANSSNNIVHTEFKSENKSKSTSLDVKSYNGGVAGQNKGLIDICQSKTNLIRAYVEQYVNGLYVYNGGVAGISEDSSTVQNCVIKDIVLENTVKSDTWYYYLYQGGLVSYLEKGTVSNCAINNLVKINHDYDCNSFSPKVLSQGTVFGFRNTNNVTVSNCFAHEQTGEYARQLVGNNVEGGITKIDIEVTSARFGSTTDIWSDTTTDGRNELCAMIHRIVKVDVTAVNRRFYEEQKFNPGKITVSITLNNGSDPINVTCFKINNLNKELTLNDTKVSVDVCGCTGTYDITIEKASPVSISIDLDQTTTQYYVGQTIQKSKIKLMATLNNGKNKEILANDPDFKIVETEYNLGKNLIHVQYKDLETCFVVTFVDNGIDRITVERVNPNKTYAVGDFFLATDVIVTIHYKDGETEIAKSSKLEILNDIIFAGVNTITVVYDAYFTASLTITSK